MANEKSSLLGQDPNCRTAFMTSNRFPGMPWIFAVVHRKVPKLTLEPILLQGFQKSIALKLIMDFSLYRHFMILYNLPSISRHISRHFKWSLNQCALLFPWSPMLRLVCRTPQRHLAVLTNGNSQQQCGTMALSGESKTCWVTSWGLKMLLGSTNHFMYHHHEVGNRPLYTAYVHNMSMCK